MKSDTPILDAVPAAEGRALLEALPADAPRRANPFLGFAAAVLGWAWRLPVGTVLLMSHLSAVLVVGWLYRWTQARVLYAWWKQSRVRRGQSFEEFCATLGPDAPALRPRWVLRQRFSAKEIYEEVYAPTADGEPPWLLRRATRWAVTPFRSLWLNLKVGALGLLATFLLTGWGCALMVFSWHYGWLNSFHKGYEEAPVGPLTGVAGILLFVAALLYVPMAQVHQAVTGDFRAFFDFRFVWRLIRARVAPYVLLAALLAGLGLLFEVLKTAPLFLDDQVIVPGKSTVMQQRWTDASDRELLQLMRQYFFMCSFFLLLSLLATRFVAAWVYRSAVLKVLRRGRVTPGQLHPTLAGWLRRLDLFPEVRPHPVTSERLARAVLRGAYRGGMFALLLLIWIGFVARGYAGEFLKFHPVVGFLNHPLVQVPCCTYIPQHLEEAAKGPRGSASS